MNKVSLFQGLFGENGLFEEIFGEPVIITQNIFTSNPLSLNKEKTHYTTEYVAAGYKKEEIKVSRKENHLVITANNEKYGTKSARFYVNDTLMIVKDSTFTLSDGILYVSVPVKKEPVKPEEIFSVS